jgi:UDP-2,3-diacylglucosamine pyrophosphatase LpxH
MIQSIPSSVTSNDQVVIVISDCHLSAGRLYEGRLNVHEDFNFDDEMCDFFEYFSTGAYGNEVSVELFINGDFLDFLNVPREGEFDDAITESLSLAKLEAILSGHPKVMAALRRFSSQPNKKITYLIGNHDADLFFPKVRERIIREWDPAGQFPSEKVTLIADRDRVRLGGGVEIHHGNQFEAVHVLNFEQPVLKEALEEPVLNIPWGSFYVLKILNRLKWEREFIDKVRPVKLFVLFSLLLDPLFTLRFVALSIFYFLKTRFVFSRRRRSSLKVTANILYQETDFLLDLERQARKLLDQCPDVKTLIFGHTHKPMNKVYPDGKQYINTGTWTKMINLDWRNIGRQYCLTFAHIRISEGLAQCELREWVGEQSPSRRFQG